jgi:hypothetical protein
MLQLAKFITIIFIASSVLERDTGRVLSSHQQFNEKIGCLVAWSWVAYWVIEI